MAVGNRMLIQTNIREIKRVGMDKDQQFWRKSVTKKPRLKTRAQGQYFQDMPYAKSILKERKKKSRKCTQRIAFQIWAQRSMREGEQPL